MIPEFEPAHPISHSPVFISYSKQVPEAINNTRCAEWGEEFGNVQGGATQQWDRIDDVSWNHVQPVQSLPHADILQRTSSRIATSTSSRLPGLLSSLITSAETLETDSGNKSKLVQEGLNFATSDGGDVRASIRILQATLCLLTSVSRRSTPCDCCLSGRCYSRAQEAESVNICGEQSLPSSDWDGTCDRKSVEHFLAILTGVWSLLQPQPSTSDDSLLCAEIQGISSGELIHAFEGIVQLATLVVGARFLMEDRESRMGATLGLSSGTFLGQHNSRSEYGDSCPWSPAVKLLSWGVIPSLEAENALFSHVQRDTVITQVPEPGEFPFEEVNKMQVNHFLKNAATSVVAAVLKGYHSWGTQQNLSHVLLTDLLDCTVESRPQVSCRHTMSHGYHPMNFCRLVGYLSRFGI